MLIVLALVAFDGFLWYSILPTLSGGLAVYFLDIGQGDSQLVRLPEGAKVLIDSGPDGKVLRELEKVLAGDRYIDLLLLTHPEADHIGGFVNILKSYEVGAVLLTGRGKDTDIWREFKKTLSDRKIPAIMLREGDRVSQGESRFDILSPGPEYMASAALNDTSIVSMLTSRNARFLFTADIDANLEVHLAEKYDIRADVLKVAHHGSKYSSSDIFLSEVLPKIAVIQVGKGNGYGHPTKEAISRLAATGAIVYRNDTDGGVAVLADGATLSVLKY